MTRTTTPRTTTPRTTTPTTARTSTSGRTRTGTRTAPDHGVATSAPRASAVSREALLEAAQVGGALAAADLTGDAEAAAAAFARWRRLRRRTDRQARQLLRVAFDTGYGRTMSARAGAAA